ncbi:sensor protein ZraS [Peptococcaceae bacterium CEB3]|nr:sensor protein ZraS [Peptococcaceae bacterium CEB3]
MNPVSWREPLAWWRKFRLQVILFSVVMSILPLAFFGWYTFGLARQSLERSVTSQHEKDVVVVAGELAYLLRDLEHGLGVFAVTEGRQMNLSRARRIDALYAVMMRLPDVQGLAAFDGEGRFLGRVSRFQVYGAHDPGESLTAAEKQALVGQRIYLGPVHLDENQQPTFHLFLPFPPGARTEPSGGLLATVSLRNIMDGISGLSPGQGGYVFVVDDRGRLIGHEDFSQVLAHRDVRQSLPPGRVIRESEASGQPVARIYTSYTGKRVLGSYMHVAGTDWAVIAEQPTSDAFAPLAKMLTALVGAAGALIALVLAVSLFFSHRLTASLGILEGGILAVAGGQVGQEITVNRKDELGQVMGAFNHLSRELAEKRRLESVVCQADRIASVGVLAAGVAHEVNNPLATISLSVEDLLDRLSSESADALYEKGELTFYLQAIREQASRCAEITGGLLEFARQQEGTPAPVNLAGLVEKALLFLSYRLKKQGVTPEIRVEPGLPEVLLDGPSMQQVLFNLCDNALDAMPAGGVLGIEAGVAGDTLTVRVKDTGMGIRPEDLPRVLEPFFTTKEPGKGTGLGLSVCYGIISRLGGEMRVESQWGIGTLVEVFLPRQARAENGGKA